MFHFTKIIDVFLQYYIFLSDKSSLFLEWNMYLYFYINYHRCLVRHSNTIPMYFWINGYTKKIIKQVWNHFCISVNPFKMEWSLWYKHFVNYPLIKPNCHFENINCAVINADLSYYWYRVYTEELPGDAGIMLFIKDLNQDDSGRYICRGTYANNEEMETEVVISTFSKFHWSYFISYWS